MAPLSRTLLLELSSWIYSDFKQLFFILWFFILIMLIHLILWLDNLFWSCFLSCMWGKTFEVDCVPLNLEIEATCRNNNTLRKRREQQERQANQGDKGVSSSTFPFDLEEPTISTHFLIFEAKLWNLIKSLTRLR